MQLWPLIHSASSPLPEPDKDAAFETFDHSGYGLLLPFQRDEKGNFAAGSGPRLWRSMVTQVLGTLCQSDNTNGELRWRTEFGSLCDTIRHRSNTAATEEIARVYVVDALRRWLPRFVVRDVAFDRAAPTPIRDGTVRRTLYCLVTFDVIDSRGNTLSTANTARVPIY